MLMFVVYAVREDDNNHLLIQKFDSQKAYFPGKHWLKAESPELLGWSSDKLNIAREHSISLATSAVLIIDNGLIVYEWGDTQKKYKCHSIRKSIMSAMIGIAISDGDIDLSKNLNELDINDTPPLTSQEQHATISDLLMARSGVYHKAAYETKSIRKKRPKRGSHDPGTFWYYNNWDFNTLLTIFEQETDKGFFTEFQQRLAMPLQMEHFQLEDTQYFLERKYSEHPAYLFRMSSLDLARFGLLYLRKGKWGEQQIIPENWVQESITMHSTLTKSGSRGYGYLWWIKNNVYYASGNRGHKLLIIPKKNIVIVHRVNTDKKKGKVNNKEYWKLIKLILQAKEYKPQEVGATRSPFERPDYLITKDRKYSHVTSTRLKPFM